MSHETTTAAFFEGMYQQNADPWNFEGSMYEQERYASILESVDGRRYSRAFEPGCSIGVLTRKLASLCDQLEAIEISPTAASRARQRCKDLPQVHIECGSLPEAIPAGEFDLIVFSEIGYYFEEEELRDIVDRLAENLNPGGYFIAAHWLGTSSDHALSGDGVHRIIRDCDLLLLDDEERHAHFRLDRMVRR
jgi:predicted TPR repeat methyltransferase